jgi:hypothetical protein
MSQENDWNQSKPRTIFDPLPKHHKKNTIRNWRKKLDLSEDELEEIYERYINSFNCEICGKQYKNHQNRHMEHDHNTKKFRNVCCASCNQRRKDRKKVCNRTTGITNISFQKGYYIFYVGDGNGKTIKIKQSKDIEFLKGFAEEWKKKNNYNT